jgi:hypothetical protein
MAEIAGLLIMKGSSRSEDDFLEVHVFRGFSLGTIDEFNYAEEPDNDADALILEAMKHRIHSAVKGRR